MSTWLASRLAGKPVETPYLAAVKSLSEEEKSFGSEKLEKESVAPGENALDIALNGLKKTLLKAREIHMKAGAKNRASQPRPPSR